jgi:hypothetical protein
LAWSEADAADRAGISVADVVAIESGDLPADTLDARQRILACFEAAGIRMFDGCGGLGVFL